MSLSRHEAYMRRRAARLAEREAEEARAEMAAPPAPEGPEEAPLEPRAEAAERPEPEPEPESDLAPETEAGPWLDLEAEPGTDIALGAKPGPVVEPEPMPAPARVGPVAPPALEGLRRITLDPRHLARNRLISAAREEPAHVAFDVLRTKLLATLGAQGWRRVAITSATPACGKSFVAANLAISLSRKAGLRTLLVDADLRRPGLAGLFGVSKPGPIAELLAGRCAPEAHLLRPAPNDLHIGEDLVMALNDRAESYAAEILQAPATAAALARLYARIAPDVVLFDMPPALYHDDVLAFRPQFDGVLIVVAGGRSTAQEVRDLRDRLGMDTPLLGVIMNRAEGEDITRYEY